MALQKGDKYDLRTYHKEHFQETQGNIHCGVLWILNF